MNNYSFTPSQCRKQDAVHGLRMLWLWPLRMMGGRN